MSVSRSLGACSPGLPDEATVRTTDTFKSTPAAVGCMVPELTRRRSLAVAGGALLGSTLLSPDRLQSQSTPDPPDADTWAGPGGGPARTNHAPEGPPALVGDRLVAPVDGDLVGLEASG